MHITQRSRLGRLGRSKKVDGGWGEESQPVTVNKLFDELLPGTLSEEINQLLQFFKKALEQNLIHHLLLIEAKCYPQISWVLFCNTYIPQQSNIIFKWLRAFFCSCALIKTLLAAYYIA